MSTLQQRKNNQGSQVRTFNLKAVVQETGLKPDTLRAWERRYGLPVPDRTDGGHRLYSQRDIDTLKWLIARQGEGLSISRAVNMWQELLLDELDPFIELPILLEEAVEPLLTLGSNLDKFRDTWVAACLEFDERSAENALSQAMAMFSAEVVCLSILQKGLSTIGLGWAEGRISAQQEHFASALAMRRLESLVAASPPPTREGRILIGCAPEEEHTFASLLLTFLMRRRGWEALYLGASVPLDRLEVTVRAADPVLIVLTAQSLHTASTLLGMAEVFVNEGVPFAYGGLIFNIIDSLHEHIPGHFLGSKLEDAPLTIEQFIKMPIDNESVRYADAVYVAAHGHFLDRQAMIEALVWDQMALFDVRPDILARANRDFSRNLVAALVLGDIKLNGEQIDWMDSMLTNTHYRLPKGVLTKFVNAYYAAALQTLDKRGDVLINWLAELIEST